jgi:hypothetical protein
MAGAVGCARRSGRPRSPIIAPAVRVGWAVKYLALTASCTVGARAEKYASAAGLGGIRGLLGVVIQLASLAIGGAQGAEIDAHGSLSFFPVSDRGAVNRASDEESGEPPQSSAAPMRIGRCRRWNHRRAVISRAPGSGPSKAVIRLPEPRPFTSI